MGDLKTCLKEAKNSIKDKDYEAALIHCKDALKIDRKNYQALAIFGRVCIELHRYADSKKALLLATQIDPENPIAWQGLSSLHEKNENCFDKEEELSILQHLTDITKEEEKLDRLYRRLASVYQKHDLILEAVESLETLISILKDDGQIKEVHKLVIDLINSVDNPSTELIEKLIEHHEELLTDSEGGENESNYQTYLRLLYKTKQFKRLVSGSLTMYTIFCTAYPLEWMARAYVEFNNFSSEFKNEEELMPEEDFMQYVEKLLQLYKGSPWGNLALGLMEATKGLNQSAILYLRRGCDALKTNLYAWIALLDIQTSSNDHGGAEATCRKICNIITQSDGLTPLKLPERFADTTALEQYTLLIRVKSLIHMGHVNHLKEAVNLMEKVENKTLDIQIMTIKALLKLESLTEAEEELRCLVNSYGKNNIEVKKITATLAFTKGDQEGAKAVYDEILKEDLTNAEALFELGKIHFEMRDFQKSLIYLLKAAKYDPKMSDAFLYIGHYYRVQDNLEKARKCYEKALNLNPGSDEAGSSLSDMYRITGEDEANLALLLRVTSEGSGSWAWLHLGLHYLAVKNFNEAIKTLQRAVEVNPKNRVCYECLGDAYLSRGSQAAALKVFTKVTEMHPSDSLYSRCQIARINHQVGLFLLSISQYEEVLNENLPDAVRTVALVGLAEVLLARAKSYKNDQLLSNLKSDCLYAIKCLTSVACENSSNSTVWKLLGDACSLQAFVPSSLAIFEVPARLLDSSVTDLAQTVEISKEELLLLGGRCYGVGLRVSNSNACLWHDLGVNIFLQGYCKLKISKESKINPEDKMSEDVEIVSDFVQRSLTALKKSLAIDPSSFNAWNSLGVVAYFKGDYPLSQHSFIRSLQLHPTVDAWTHLGTLYLSQEDIHLAHEAFSHAQALDPSFVACWVGQAMVATSIGHYEAFDLYRHTTLLGINPESCVGFASNVLRIACDKNNPDNAAKIDQYIPNVVDSLTYYTREREDDAVAQNMLGLTLEMLGLYNSASEALSKAVVSCMKNDNLNEDIRDGIICNYSRVLTTLNKVSESLENYQKIKEPDFYSQCGMALSQFKASQYEESYQRYAETIEWFASEKLHKSHVFVALAFLQYKFKNIDGVKDILFQNTSIQGLLALTSLGLILEDATLTAAALAELEPYVDSKDYAPHIAFLKSIQATLKYNFKEAKLILARAIHRHPHMNQLWRSLSRQLLTFPDKETPNSRLAAAATAAAAAARSLAQSAKDNENVFQDVVLKVMAHLKTLAIQPTEEKGKKKKKGASSSPPKAPTMSKDDRKVLCLKEAQRAVLMCPGKSETWAALIASLDSKSSACKLAAKLKNDAAPQLRSWFEEVSCC